MCDMDGFHRCLDCQFDVVVEIAVDAPASMSSSVCQYSTVAGAAAVYAVSTSPYS